MGLTPSIENEEDDTVPETNAMCKRLCKEDYIPICGTDDVTYTNECFLDCEQKRNKKVGIAWFGDCVDKDRFIEFTEPGIDFDTIEDKEIPLPHHDLDVMIRKQMGIKEPEENINNYYSSQNNEIAEEVEEYEDAVSRD